MSKDSAKQDAANAKASSSFDWSDTIAKLGPLIFLVVLVVFFYSYNERFLSTRNIFNILTEVSIFGMLAPGMIFVILTAGIDLSVGSTLAAAGIVSAAIVTGGQTDSFSATTSPQVSWGYALLASLLVGTLAGAMNGSIAKF